MEALATGHVVAGRFEIERPAAAGSFGAIYLATDRTNGSQVALKVLLRESDGPRFTREARVLADIHDPGVVPYIDHGVDEGRPYLAMRWLEGEDLDLRLARAPLTVSETIALGIRIARGLGAAHARGVVHRDVKPTNILLERREPERAVLLDFGIARSRSERTQTAIGMVVGTPGYLSPEQARAESQVDSRADVFALAAVLWECVAGRAVFDGATVMTILTKVLFEPVPRLDQAVVGAPRDLSDLLARALSKEPADRPRDGSDFADLLAGLSGQTASPSPQRASIGDVERTLVTVVVARDHDPPTAGLATWTALAAKDASRLETLADGTVAALVRGQSVATDQAASAARLALALKAARPSLAVGVATGRGVVGADAAIGDVIARAGALVGGAPGIVVDPTTAGLLADRFRMRLDARGAELLAEDQTGRSARRVVGRDRELELAESLFARSLEDRESQVLLLTSEPGIGKTALAREVVARIAAADSVPTVWQVGGERLREDEPWALLSRLFKSAGAPDENDPTRASLALERWASSRLGEGDPAVDLVLSIAGLTRRESSPFVRAARESQGVFSVHAHETLLRLAQAESERSPLLFVLEDLHHADAASFDAIVAVALAEVPARMVMVATSRLELDAQDRIERLARGPRVTRVTLGRLARRAAESLVREGLEGSADLEARVADICVRADGSPFLLGELVRAERAGVRGLPGTVSAVLQGRFDALPGLARRVLRAASVLGGGSHDDILAVTGPLDIKSALDALITEGILTREPGTDLLAFRNPLLHEVAYGMLTEDDRTLAHRLVAERLEVSGRGSPVLLAEHWLRGKDPARAAAWLGQAARDALATDDVVSSVRFAERGLPGSTGALRGDLLATIAEARLWKNELGGAAEAASEAIQLLPKGTRAWCRAVGASGVAEGRLGNADALEALAADLVLVGGDVDPQGPSALATALARVSNHLFFLSRLDAANAVAAHLEGIAEHEGQGDPLVEMRVAQALAIATRFRGDLAAHVAWSERALDRAQAMGDRRSSAMLVTNLGDALRNVGRAAEAEPLLRTGLEAARSMGLTALELPMRINLGATLNALGKHEEAARELELAMKQLETAGDARIVVDARLTYVYVLLRGAQPKAAAAVLKETMTRIEEDSPYRPLALTLSAMLALGRGENEAACRDAALATQLIEGAPPDASESLMWTTLTEARRAVGDGSGADQAVSEGWSRVLLNLETLGPFADDALQKVPELRRLHELAIEVGVANPPEAPTRDTLPP